MTELTKTITRNLFQEFSNNIDRYGVGVIALILMIELLWAASILAPVLFVLATFMGFMKNWMAILPGFWGGATFLLILGVCGFAASLPSNYVARWRENMMGKISARYP
ncbi:MAG: hypothetical protein JKY20_05515 [Alphaproteobacteria bacterium]|nr:hypothetical protein [Alphaproteobacteria bacterium]